MTEIPSESRCPLCGGAKKSGKTIYSVDLGFGVIVVRNVPATICDQCGEAWIDAETAKDLERMTEESRRRRREVEVVTM